MKKSELKKLIKEEIEVMLNETLTIQSIEPGRDTGMAYGAIGGGYKITLSNGDVIESDDEDLLGRYAKLRTNDRISLKDLNNILQGKVWDTDY